MAALLAEQKTAELGDELLRFVHLSSEFGGAAGARSVTRAIAPGACWPVRVSGSASAFGLRHPRSAPHPSSCKAQLRAERQRRPSADHLVRLEIGEIRVYLVQLG